MQLPEGPLGPVLGFGNCARCPYRVNGPVRVCVECAQAYITPVADEHCEVCSQALDEDGYCTNLGVCTERSRNITAIDAIAVFDGPLRRAIMALKYQGLKGWARIFGRLVAGWVMEQQYADPSSQKLVLPNPTFESPNKTLHTELVVQYAYEEDVLDLWDYQSYEYPILIKTAETPKSAAKGLAGKRASAAALPSVLQIQGGDEAIEGRQVVLFDDVCTTGYQLDAVAGFLLDHGAADVRGLVLARTPWK